MVVAFLTTEYPSEPFFAGGLASYLKRVATALLGSGHGAEVFVAGDSDEVYEQDGVRVTRVKPGDRWQRRTEGKSLVWRCAPAARIYDRAAALELAVTARMASQAIDVVQAPDFMAPGLTLALSGRVPVVTRLSHYGPLWQAAYRTPPSRALLQQHLSERHQMRASRAVYAPSQFLAEKVSAAEGLPVSVIRPPFDAATTSTHRGADPGFGFSRATYALFFGTIGLMKGADRLVNVLPGVLSACPDMHFVFAGNARSTQAGEPFDEAIRRHFPNRVTVLPALRQDELMPLVSGARFVVLPSRIENLSNACLEAMALGRPVIATRGASFEEVITPGVSGELVSQDDDEELARVMRAMWEADPARLTSLGRSAMDRIATDFAPSRTIAPLVTLLDSARSNRASATRSRIAFALDLVRTAGTPI